MLKIKFKYADEWGNWEWHTRECIVESVQECVRIYGLLEDDVKFEMISIVPLEDSDETH